MPVTAAAASRTEAPLDVHALHPPAQPDRDALTALAEIWMNRTTGVLECELLAAEAQLIMGEPADEDGLATIISALYIGGITVREQALTVARVALPVLGAHLWEAASRIADPERIARRIRFQLVPHEGLYSVYRRLPLGDGCRALMGQLDDGPVPIGKAAVAAGTTMEDISEDVANLMALGFVTLEKPARLDALKADHARATQPPPLEPKPKPPSRDKRMEQAALLRRLRREWDTLADARSWTVLGLSPTMAVHTIEEGCFRMSGRYRPIADDPENSPEVRELAERLDERVKNAIKIVQRKVKKRIARGPEWTGDEPTYS